MELIEEKLREILTEDLLKDRGWHSQDEFFDNPENTSILADVIDMVNSETLEAYRLGLKKANKNHDKLFEAEYMSGIDVADTDGSPVNLTVFKHENNGVFAIDSSFIEQVLGEDLVIQDPFEENCNVILNCL